LRLRSVLAKKNFREVAKRTENGYKGSWVHCHPDNLVAGYDSIRSYEPVTSIYNPNDGEARFKGDLVQLNYDAPGLVASGLYGDKMTNSFFHILLEPKPEWNPPKYNGPIGRVISGLDVLQKLKNVDELKNVDKLKIVDCETL